MRREPKCPTWTPRRAALGGAAGTTLPVPLEDEIRPNGPPLVLTHQREVLALPRPPGDAIVLDLPVALAYARQSPHAYSVAAQLPSDYVLAAALPKGSGNLEAVDSAIRAFTNDGTIEALGQRWLHTSLREGQAEGVPVLRTGE